MKFSKKTIVFLFFLTFTLFPVSAIANHNVLKGITFLDDVKRVAWYKIQGKHIVIGWKGIPEDFYGWNHRTAVRASRLNGKQINVWAVRHHQKEWSPGEGGHICLTTALRGRLYKTNCRK